MYTVYNNIHLNAVSGSNILVVLQILYSSTITNPHNMSLFTDDEDNDSDSSLENAASATR